MTAFFLAVGILVLGCLSIAVDRYFNDMLTWLPVSLTIIGMFSILTGAYFMIQESRLTNSKFGKRFSTFEETQPFRKKKREDNSNEMIG